MSEVSKETLNALEGARTEIGANRALTPSNDFSRGFNEGMTIAMNTIRRYERGEGLWQLAEDKEDG